MRRKKLILCFPLAVKACGKMILKIFPLSHYLSIFFLGKPPLGFVDIESTTLLISPMLCHNLKREILTVFKANVECAW